MALRMSGVKAVSGSLLSSRTTCSTPVSERMNRNAQGIVPVDAYTISQTSEDKAAQSLAVIQGFGFTAYTRLRMLQRRRRQTHTLNPDPEPQALRPKPSALIKP